mmetsp:Transcript_52695/g.83623  ORF Transcript_52695/g.83623 Transcript_52695/m.83623 type:complete len:221 (+) Transcript_52695:52-714(+)
MVAFSRWAIVGLAIFHVQAAIMKAEPESTPEEATKSEGLGGKGMQYPGYEKDWHNEWRKGDFPSWKKVIKVDGIEKWEDSQSDGKPGFLQGEPAKESASASSEDKDLHYANKEFKKDWHTEWRNGDYPSWKDEIKVDGIEKFEDRQSDGKPGFLQTAAAPAPATAAAPASSDSDMSYSAKYKDDWHEEWKHGNYPSWKKTIDVDGIEKYEDRQSDGKPGF